MRITSDAAVTNSPCTLACWAKSTNTSDGMSLMSACRSDGLSFMAMFARGFVAGDPISAYITPSDTTSDTTSGYSSDVWFHAAATFSGNTPMSIASFINGGNKSTASINFTPSGINRMAIGANLANNSAFNHFQGQIADAAVWNVVLSDDEIASLADGMTAEKVRPQSLVWYAPLLRDLVEIKGGKTLTNNNTATVADHPRVYA